MAARTSRLIVDQNSSGFDGATALGKADFTEQKKVGRAGGRKPLGDLSNSGKPSVSHASKQLKSKNLTIIDEEAATAKPRNVESNKRTVSSKASGKSQTGNRKALSDISNSGKLPLREIKNKNSTKLSALAEEPHFPNAIAEEKFLHNHRECMKSQSTAMDMGHFLETLGLESDTAAHLTSSSELPAFSKLKQPDLELEEIPEQLTEVECSWTQNGSPTLCKTPKLANCYSMYEVNFKLMETPDLSKR